MAMEKKTAEEITEFFERIALFAKKVTAALKTEIIEECGADVFEPKEPAVGEQFSERARAISQGIEKLRGDVCDSGRRKIHALLELVTDMKLPPLPCMEKDSRPTREFEAGTGVMLRILEADDDFAAGEIVLVDYDNGVGVMASGAAEEVVTSISPNGEDPVPCDDEEIDRYFDTARQIAAMTGIIPASFQRIYEVYQDEMAQP